MSRQQSDCLSLPRTDASIRQVIRRDSRFTGASRRIFFAGSLLIVALFTHVAAAAPYSILYYGNSFMWYGTRTIPELLSDLAVAAGHNAPNFVNASYDGIGLEVHLQYNTAVIGSSLAPGESWDFVVMQGYSTGPTYLGDLALHRASAVGLHQAVTAHSPGAVPVLFETWARAPGHEFYLEDPWTNTPPAFPGGPLEMQQQLHDGYLLTADDINTDVGQAIARIAQVGWAFQNTGFDLMLYDEDLYHLSDAGNLLGALVLYSTIYGGPLAQLDLTDVLASLNLSAEDGAVLTAMANTVTPIPEPSTVALLATALASLFGWRMRRRR